MHKVCFILVKSRHKNYTVNKEIACVVWLQLAMDCGLLGKSHVLNQNYVARCHTDSRDESKRK